MIIYCSSPPPCLIDDLTVINPMNRQHMGIQDQKDKGNILGKQLNHIITEDKLFRLLTVELPNFQFLKECCVGEGLCGHLCKVKTWPVQ